MQWILIIFINLAHNGPHATQVGPYRTEAACEAAAAKVLERLKDPRVSLKFACVKTERTHA
jgi:hypothetical protein